MSEATNILRIRGRFFACLSWIAASLTGLLPTAGRAEEIGMADPILPLPLYHNKPDNFGTDGGLFFSTSFVAYKQTNPISQQGVAYRGFTDVTGTASVPYTYDPVTGQTTNAPVAPFVGHFYGSGTEALNTESVSGPGTLQPGIKVEAGWRFGDRVTVTASWMWLADATYTSSASNIPAGLQIGSNYADSYLSAPVYNFYPEYAGPNEDLYNSNGASIPNTVQNGVEAAKGAGYGIYGESNGYNQAIYTNIVSTRMYGAQIGAQNEWYMGHGFALNVTFGGSMFADIVKARARYELGQKNYGPVSKRSRTLYEFVPELSGQVGIAWYPFEGIEMKFNYNAMGFFNTISSRHPIDFDFGTVDPAFNTQTRWFSGFQAGIALVF